jgi:hypothetical protein
MFKSTNPSDTSQVITTVEAASAEQIVAAMRKTKSAQIKRSLQN